MEHWEAHTLEHLFRRIRDTMPPGEAGSLDGNEKRDAMAYLLQQNGFPAGSAELAQDADELAAVQIARKTGPGPLKTGAVVRVAGCLAQRSERGWELTGAAEPERTTLDAPPATVRQPSDPVALGDANRTAVECVPESRRAPAATRCGRLGFS